MKDYIGMIADYIRSGEKKRENFTMGMEMEHFIVHGQDGSSVSYYGDGGVGETLAFLADKMDFKVSEEDGHILGLTSPLLSVSIEPSSQLELAIKSQESIKDLEDNYKAFMEVLLDHLDEKDQSLVALGYQPLTKIDDIKIIPKHRYGHMYDYFKKRGSMAHNMMKGTSSVQTAIDYESEEDFRIKYQVLSVLSPIFYALYDNAYIFEGRPSKDHAIRQKIWENTDSDRSGLFEIGFDRDLTYRKYAEKIYHTPIIFRESGGKTISTQDKTLKDLVEKDKVDLTEDLIFHALSIVFPDIRAKTYLEVRMFDAVPYPLNFTIPALVKGLFYDEENLAKLYDLTKSTSYGEAIQAKKEVVEKGLAGKYLGRPINDLAASLYSLAMEGLDDEDRLYLSPLKPYIEGKKTPRDDFEKTYQEEGLLEAIDKFKIRLEG